MQNKSILVSTNYNAIYNWWIKCIKAYTFCGNKVGITGVPPPNPNSTLWQKAGTPNSLL